MSENRRSNAVEDRDAYEAVRTDLIVEDHSPDYDVPSHFVEELHVDAKSRVMSW